MVLYGEYGYYGPLYEYKFVQFLGFSWEFIITLDLLKVGLLKPYFV